MTDTMDRPSPRCAGCKQAPSTIDSYLGLLEDGETADEYVRREEGTYDPATGAFLCDWCYIRAGMPTGEGGRRWTATPGNLAALGL